MHTRQSGTYRKDLSEDRGVGFMEIRLLYFGKLRELTGKRDEAVDLAEGSNLGHLWAMLALKYGEEFQNEIQAEGRFNILVNGQHFGFLKSEGVPLLRPGDTIVFIPVFMGG